MFAHVSYKARNKIQICTRLQVGRERTRRGLRDMGRNSFVLLLRARSVHSLLINQVVRGQKTGPHESCLRCYCVRALSAAIMQLGGCFSFCINLGTAALVVLQFGEGQKGLSLSEGENAWTN